MDAQNMVEAPKPPLFACCLNPENLKRSEADSKPNVECLKCQECGRRHFTMQAEAGRIGMKVFPIGTQDLDPTVFLRETIGAVEKRLRNKADQLAILLCLYESALKEYVDGGQDTKELVELYSKKFQETIATVG